MSDITILQVKKNTLASVASCHEGKISKHSEQMCASYRVLRYLKQLFFLQEDTSDTLNKPFRSDSPPLGPFFMERLVQKSLRYYIPRFADYKFRNRLWLCLISQSFKLRKHTLAPVVSCHAGKISKHSEQMCAKYRTRSLFNFKNNCDEWLQQEKRLKNYQFPKISERKNAVTYGNGPIERELLYTGGNS